MNEVWRDGNRVELLINGEDFFPSVFRAIEQARHEVLLETFILRDDKVGRGLRQVLIDAAGRGVRVEVIADGYGTPDLDASYLGGLLDAGVRLHLFDPQPLLLGMRTNLFRRLHRKHVVVDGAQAFVGGINFSADHLADFGPWPSRTTQCGSRAPAWETSAAPAWNCSASMVTFPPPTPCIPAAWPAHAEPAWQSATTSTAEPRSSSITCAPSARRRSGC